MHLQALFLFLRRSQHAVLFLHLRIRSVDDMILYPYMVQRKCQRLQRLLPHLRFQLTLPYRNAVPSHLCQTLLLLDIPLLVPPDLRHPELTIRLRNLAATLMPVPKAPVHEYARSIFPQHKIRMPRQFRRVQPVSESPFPQTPPHYHLRLRILRADRRHVLVTLLCCEYIHCP